MGSLPACTFESSAVDVGSWAVGVYLVYESSGLRTPRPPRFKTEGTPAWNPIVVSRRKTQGWHNLIMLVAGGGVRPGYWTELRFNGTSYPDDPRAGVEVRESRVLGRAFIADDWWTGFGGIELPPPDFKAELKGVSNRQHNKTLQLTAR